jgi:hypothetical protein
MTAKEMAHWEHWHRQGRQRFQLTQATTWFVVQGILGSLASYVLDLNLTHFYWLGTGIALATLSWFSSGNFWDQREDDYEKQCSSGPCNTARG